MAFEPLDFPLLAATETSLPKPGDWVVFLFQNSSIGYTLPAIKVNTRHVKQAFFRSAHLRSPGRIENSFANESFIDKIAFAAKAAPAEFRMRFPSDRGRRPGRAEEGDGACWRGASHLCCNNASTCVAAVAEVAVNRLTGEIKVERVYVAHDCGQLINPGGTVNQVEGGVIQTVSRTLIEQVTWNRAKVLSRD